MLSKIALHDPDMAEAQLAMLRQHNLDGRLEVAGADQSAEHIAVVQIAHERTTIGLLSSNFSSRSYRTFTLQAIRQEGRRFGRFDLAHVGRDERCGC